MQFVSKKRFCPFNTFAQSFRLWLSSYKHTWIILILLSICTYFQTRTFNFFLIASAVQEKTTRLKLLLAVDSVLFVIVSILAVILFIFLFQKINLTASGPKLKSFEHKWSLILRIILYTIIVGAAFALAGSIFYLIGGMFRGSLIHGLWVIVWLAAFVFVSVLISVSIVSLLMENTGPIQCIRRSFELVWKHWWYAFFVLLIGVVCIAIIEAILVVIGLIISGTSLNALQSPETPRSIFIVNALIRGLVSMPFFVSLTYVLYNRLKSRH